MFAYKLKLALFSVGILMLIGTWALARSPLDIFPGTTAPGAHELRGLANIEADYCLRCHVTLSAMHPVVTAKCLTCHAPVTGAHSASPAQQMPGILLPKPTLPPLLPIVTSVPKKTSPTSSITSTVTSTVTPLPTKSPNFTPTPQGGASPKN
jgi:hypothetical protein